MMKSPRQKRHQKTKQAIIEIAKQMVAEQGYENLSLRAVANEADYSPAGLYEYFDSREDLLKSISTQVNADMVAALDQIPAPLLTAERLLEMCLVYIRFALEHRQLYRLMSSIPSSRRSLSEPASEGSAYNLFLHSVQTLLEERGYSKGAGYSAEEITYGLWATVHGMVSLRASFLQDFDADFDTINHRLLNSMIQDLVGE